MAATELVAQEWYTALVDDCRAIITEAVFNSRWALVEGYHALGERIVTDTEYKKWEQGKAGGVLQDLAKDLRVALRTVYYAIKFYELYPRLDKVPEGKNISWNKIITKYLPAPKTTTAALPVGRYGVIYADPPWHYEEHGVSEDRSYGGQDKQYPSLTAEELAELPVADIAAEDCALFLWTTSPKLNEVWPIIDAWGFAYKTSFVWDKVKHNFGYYNSVRHELLLVCGRGSSTPEVNKLFDSVVAVERSPKHSEKPDEFRKIIETLYPSAKKVELFARSHRPGWDQWGDEVS